MKNNKMYRVVDMHDGWWRDIPGADHKYQISKDGIVRRILDNGKARNLTGFFNHDKYVVKIYYETQAKNERVISLMVKTFFGKVPDGKLAFHINGIKCDNSIYNIGFCTREELGKITGGQNEKRRATEKVDQSGEVLKVYSSVREAARDNHMSHYAVLSRCNNKIENPFINCNYTFRFTA